MDDITGKSTAREEWRKRVERWKDSGLTAKQFAAETGINAGTLQFWRTKLKRPFEQPGLPTSPRDLGLPAMIEIRPSIAMADARFEVELKNGRRIHVPARFEATQLQALVKALEAA